MEILRDITQIQIKEKTAVALGFFDGVHIGHQAVISKAGAYTNSNLSPCVFTFSSVNLPSSKISQPLIDTESIKAEKIKSLGVKYLVLADFMKLKDYTPVDFIENIIIKQLNAGAVICGSDFRFGKNGQGDVCLLKEICDEHQIKVNIVDGVQFENSVVSSTRIREYIENGDVEKANQLLGDYYCIDYKVIKGRQLGRKISFPTINQVFDPGMVMPKFGVYAVMVKINNLIYPAVANVGIKPTVGSEYPLCETYIVDYEGDLYNQNIPVYFLKYLRAEMKFDTIELLKQQIEQDTKTAISLFNNIHSKV